MLQQQASKNEELNKSHCFQQEHLVNHTVPQAKDLEKKMSVISGHKPCESLENYSPIGLLEKMLLDLSQWRWMMFSKNWKQCTTKRGHLYYQLAVSGLLMKESGFLSLATPTASQCYKPIRALCPSEMNGTHGKTLPGSLGERYPEHIGKRINPRYVEWMMGLPIGWTELNQPS